MVIEQVTRRPLATEITKRKLGRRRRDNFRAAAIAFALLALLVAGGIVAYRLIHADHVYPGVFDAQGLGLGALSREAAAAALAERYRPDVERELRVRSADREWLVTAEALGARLDIDGVLASAFRVGREGSLAQQVADQLDALRLGRAIGEQPLRIEEGPSAAYAMTLETEINRSTIDARLSIAADLSVDVVASQSGRWLDIEQTIRLLKQALAERTAIVDLPVTETQPAVLAGDLQSVKTVVAKMLSAPLSLQFGNRTWTLSPGEIRQMLVLEEAAQGKTQPAKLDEDGVARFVAKLAADIDQAHLPARFRFSGGSLRVAREARPGYEVDRAAATAAIEAGVLSDNRTVALPVKVTTPAGLSTYQQAIRDLVSSATTSYGGGVAERRHNIELAAAKLDGVVVGPGEIFSFNEELGPMTVKAGFQWGWGVSQSEDGQAITVPSVAGGICQVSTTLFQAIFWAGYQIEERSWHLYWIDRYGQPPAGMKGLDATVDQVYDKNGKLVYAVDLKFRNTTANPIVIEAKTDGGRLTFNLYSTKPDWEVKVDPPLIENVVQADGTVVRELDPNMAPGEELWIEAAQDGFTSTIVRTVTEKGKEPRRLRLVSTYQPARNVVRAGPAPSAASEPVAP